jgi:hypothetical protein
VPVISTTETFLITLTFIFPFNAAIIITIDLGFQICGFLSSVTGMFIGGGSVRSYLVVYMPSKQPCAF